MTESDPTVASAKTGPPAGAATAPTFKDRRAGLIVFGVLLLLMALASLGSAGLQVLMLAGFDGMTAGVEPRMDSSILGYAAGFYFLIAVATAWLGIGSIQCRRWARALLLVLSAMGLVVGIITSIYMVGIVGDMSEQIVAQTGDDEAAAIVPFIMGCMMIFVGFIYLVLPAAFFFFFRSPHVKATCEHHDPTPRWTDRYPPPVLAGGLLLLFYSLIFFTPILGTPMPLFGRLLTGVPALAYALVVGLLAAYLALAFLRFERWAWIGSVVFVAATGVSAYLTFRGGGLAAVYEAMGYPAEQLDMMASMGIMRGFSTLILVSVVLTVGFFLWLGRYFKNRLPA